MPSLTHPSAAKFGAALVASSVAFAALLACAARAAQDPKPKPTPPDLPSKPVTPPAAPDATAAAPVLGADGKPLVPGKLPDDASPEARAAWTKLLAASLASGGVPKPITAFSARIDVRFKASAEQVNELKGEYEFLTPGFVRIRVQDPQKLERLRGPEGDFLIDDHGVHALDRVDKDNEQDLRQIDDFVAMARNFVALTNPSALRVASLKRLATAPAGIDAAFAERAKALQWLEVRSPDFRLTRAAATNKGAAVLYRVQLGLDPATSLPEAALLDEVKPGGDAATPPLAPTTLFLKLEGWAASDGYQIPKQIKVFEVDEASLAAGKRDPLALRFRADPSSDVFLSKPRLNPPLKPESFLAPRR